MSKLVIQLKVHGLIEFDGGYYRNDNMDKIEELVRRKLDSYQIFVKEGAGEPQLLRGAHVTLDKVIYEARTDVSHE